MAEDGSDKSGLQQFTERWFAPAALVISGFASLFSYWAQQAASELKAANDKAILQREYAFRVTQLVLTTITDPDKRKQDTLGVLVNTVDEPFKTKLVSVLIHSADSAVSKEVATATFEQQNQADASGGAAARQARRTIAPGAEAVAGTEQLAGYQPKGWDIDIFWCQGGTAEAERYNKGKLLGDRLAQLSIGKQKLGNAILGRVRLRSLSPTINSQPGYRIVSDVILRDEGKGEEDTGRSLQSLANSIDTPLGLSQSQSATPWYISVFFCK